MQYSAIIISLMASLAIASPSMPLPRGGGSSGGSSYDACGSSVLLDSQAVCCSSDLLDLVGLECAAVSETPTSAKSFASICSKSGQSAKCCTLTAAGLGVVCATPEGL